MSQTPRGGKPQKGGGRGGASQAADFIERLKKRPLILVLGAVLAVVSLVVGILSDSLDIGEKLGTNQPAQAGPSSGPVAGTSVTVLKPSVEQTSNPPTVAAGECRSSVWMDVPCDSNHSYEALDTGCDQAAVTGYLGGVVGRDVVMASPTSHGGRCWVRLLVETDETVRGRLAGTDSAAAWRQCVNERSDEIVGCDRAHSGEYFATGETSAKASRQCETKASAYMRKQLSDVSDVLRVRAVSHPSRSAADARCVIEVLGQQMLTTSVFDLGSDAVPVDG